MFKRLLKSRFGNNSAGGTVDNQRTTKLISTLLIGGGLVLIGIGAWAPIRDYFLAQQLAPPPLPEEAVGSLAANPLPVGDGVSLEDNPLPADIFVPTETPTPTPTPEPTATPTGTPTTDLTASADQADLPPTATPMPPTATPVPPTATPDSFPPSEAPPSRIVIPAIDLDSEVVEVGWRETEVEGQSVSVWEVAKYAAGWHRNSALPGHTGNIVLSGHHNVLGEVFRHTVDLEPGDIITLYVDKYPYQYQVEDKFIIKDKDEPAEVRQANARWIGPFSDQRLTLITCWPYTNNTHRVVVIAKPFTGTERIGGEI